MPTRSPRSLHFLLAWLLLVLAAAPLGAQTGRVIVLGFDGADARTTEQWMDAGKLPNLARLREQGSYAPLGTTTPAESPVSWAALNSGRNPAKTGVSGFVTRKFGPGGEPQPETGFYSTARVSTAQMELAFWQRFLVTRTPLAAAWAVGGAVALLFLLLFLVVLRLAWWLALALALLLGAAGGWGGWSASHALPRAIDDVWKNATKAGGFWEDAARAGVPSLVIDGAMAWDRPEVENAKVLAGLGLPDARGDYGSWCLYTTRDDQQAFERAPQRRDTGSGGRVFLVDEREGQIHTFLYGPYDPLRTERLERELAQVGAALEGGSQSSTRQRELERRKRDLTAELRDIRSTKSLGESDEYRLFVPLDVLRQGTDAVEVRIGAEKQVLREGEWSDWFHPRFDSSTLFQVHTVTRVKVRKLADPFELLVDFLHFDPRHPPFYQPLSQPQGFAGELAQAIGTDYETVGWACLTHGYKDAELDPRTFLEDIEFTHEWRRKLLLAALERDDWRLLVDIESTPDRVQHMCYQFADPQHPLYRAEAAAETLRLFGEEIRFSQAIEASYRAMDRMVGDVLARMRPEDTLLICSDHGFQSFRRQCHLNNWLAEHGYLGLKPGLTRADAVFPAYIDWSRTQAYAIGLGMIFLNRMGREAEGIVREAEVPALLERLERDLLATEDGGAKAVHSVQRLATIHHGPFLEDEAELMVGFAAGWRVGWSTTTGNIKLEGKDGRDVRPAAVFSDNLLNWSGDHVSVSEDLVRGIFFSNRKVALPASGPNLLHIAPTVLSWMKVALPADYDLPALELAR